MFIPKLYNDQLLYGFYLKRGKALAIPQILYSIRRLIALYPKKKIRILDIGCNDGRLIEILHHIAQANGFLDRIELYGLDKNNTSLEQARNIAGVEATYYSADLCDPSTFPKQEFDLMIAINVMHEVFSVFSDHESEDEAKKHTAKIFKSLISLLSQTGSFVLYDGLMVSKVNGIYEDIQFTFRTEEAKKRMFRIIDEYDLYRLNCQELDGNLYAMSKCDFLRAIGFMKYIDTPVWDIESTQSYHYFSYEEFSEVFVREKCIMESVVVLNGDRGLWENYVQIVSPGVEFPAKSIIVTATKGYIPPLAQFDNAHVLEFA